MKLRHFFLIFTVLVLFAGFFFFHKYKVPYNIHTKGIVYPNFEWKITKSDDGSIKSELTDYSINAVTQYSVLEFQRGDHAEFFINPEIYHYKHIQRGDTIGHIRSKELYRQMIELQGELNSQKKLLSVYATGAKQEEIDAAFERFILAEQEYLTQKNITERNRILHDDNYISDEEFELSLNQYKTKLNKLNIAKHEYKSVKTGAKPEQLAYIQTNIEALKSQISHIESIINSYSILSPISGKLIRKHEMIDDSPILRIADLSKHIIVFPVETNLIEYIEPGQKVEITTEAGQKIATGVIISTDNEVQMLNRRQNLFVTAYTDSVFNEAIILPKMVVEVKVDCKNIRLTEYLERMFNSVYQN